MGLTFGDVKKQSLNVFGQFGEKWQKFSEINYKLPHKDAEKLRNSGIGKFMVLAAMGESVEENIELLKKYRDRIEITTCDKGFGMLLEQGIKADYVMLCDCNIPFRWIEKYIDQTKDVKLLATPYANVEWTKAWKGERYFFINKDAIKTERIFQKIFGNIRVIPAGSNVSNAMAIFWNGADEKQKLNFGGYENYLLIGYDYSWRYNGRYYAFNDPKPKKYYMNHQTLLDLNQNMVFSSANLVFSTRWMLSYCNAFKLPMINCSNRGLLDIKNKGKLEDCLKIINPNKQYSINVRKNFSSYYKSVRKMYEEKNKLDQSREGLLQ